MYIQVYGVPPDNGGVSSTFLRGVYMFQEEANVNWAEWAAKIHGGRMKNARHNPNKLIPPALREQIQGILTILGGYISGSMDPNSLKLGDLSLSMPPTARMDTLSTFMSTQHPLQTAGVAAGPSLDSRVTSLLNPLEKRRRSILQPAHKRQKLLRNAEETESLSQPSPLDLAMQEKVSIEAKLLQVQDLQAASIKKLEDTKESLIKLEEKELLLSNEQTELQAQAKVAGAGGALDKKREFDTAARGKNQELVEIAQRITAATKLVAKFEHESESLLSQSQDLHSEVACITAKIDGMILDAASIKPRLLFPKLPNLLGALCF
jgi:hypothetical protein